MTELIVYLDSQLCGLIEQSSSGNIIFRYEREYREADDPTPLSLSMPLAASIHKKCAILPCLQGLLPDSEEPAEHGAVLGTEHPGCRAGKKSFFVDLKEACRGNVPAITGRVTAGRHDLQE